MNLHQKLAVLALLAYVSTAFSFEVYFNQTDLNSYKDPYRNIWKQGDNLEAIIIEEILAAKKSIVVAVQELRLPGIAQALIAKQKAGVDVRVVIENKYNNDLVEVHEMITRKPLRRGDEFMAKAPRPHHVGSRDYYIYLELFQLVDENKNSYVTPKELLRNDAIHMLRKAKVPLIDDTADGSVGSGLMHHKFIVIDDDRVVISSANFTMSGIHGDFANPRTLGNANAMIIATSRSLADSFLDEFDLMWGGAYSRSRFGLKKPYRGRQNMWVGGSKVTVQFSPTSQSMPWSYTVNGLIGDELSKSKAESLLALFVFSDQNIADILRSRAETHSSFRLGLLIEPKFAYRYYSELLDIMGIKLRTPTCDYEPDNAPWRAPRRDVGIPSLDRGDLLHHKFAVVDRSTVIMGSQNWSASANHTNDENVIVIKNKAVAKAFAYEFERLNKNSFHGIPRSLQRKIHEAERNCRPLIMQ